MDKLLRVAIGISSLLGLRYHRDGLARSLDDYETFGHSLECYAFWSEDSEEYEVQMAYF